MLTGVMLYLLFGLFLAEGGFQAMRAKDEPLDFKVYLLLLLAWPPLLVAAIVKKR